MFWVLKNVLSQYLHFPTNDDSYGWISTFPMLIHKEFANLFIRN
ncbi:hypothetical protein T03_2161 [Trichinella britovi]|uniref:Uncharacterized protein n=1 Tax=Trichinella britovi TaxID=45882 RepID=A0A0V0Z4C0_TRIBR|nr:hypothetical protein T03_2161 [Trichinella britovi]